MICETQYVFIKCEKTQTRAYPAIFLLTLVAGDLELHIVLSGRISALPPLTRYNQCLYLTGKPRDWHFCHISTVVEKSKRFIRY